LIWKSSPLKSNLETLNLPIFIPPVPQSEKFMNIEMFFITMRSEERRLETYNIDSYPFPFGADYATKLAKNGLFYTLLNCTVQCAFCRIVIGNLGADTTIEELHKLLSKQCKFAFGEDCNNEPIIEPVLKPRHTDNTVIQCKICLQNEINVVYRCGHLIMCSSCSENLVHCPTCRADLTNRQRIYIS